MPYLLRRYRHVLKQTEDSSDGEEPFWRPLHHEADRQIPLWVPAIVAALADMGQRLPRAALTTALLHGDVTNVRQVLTDTWARAGADGLASALAPHASTLAQTAAQAEARRQRMVAPPAEYIEAGLMPQLEADMALMVDATMDATAQAAVQGVASSLPLPAQVAELVESVGLTSRQAATLARYRAGLQQAGDSTARVMALTQARATVLRAQRAQMIARTEAQTALNVGIEAPWRARVARGEIAADTVRRFWVTTEDERLCALCAPIPRDHPAGVALDEVFITEVGTVERPPLHPQCRCMVELRRMG